MARTGLDAVARAAQAIGGFDSRPWIADIDVPTAVVVTERDRVIPTVRQHQLGRAIDGATVHAVEAGHGACVTEPDRFAPALLDACERVSGRVAARSPARRRATAAAA